MSSASPSSTFSFLVELQDHVGAVDAVAAHAVFPGVLEHDDAAVAVAIGVVGGARGLAERPLRVGGEDRDGDHFEEERVAETRWMDKLVLPLSLPLLSWIAGLCREPAAPATHLLACLGSTHCGNSTYTGVLRAYILYQKAKSLITFKSIWIRN